MEGKVSVYGTLVYLIISHFNHAKLLIIKYKTSTDIKYRLFNVVFVFYDIIKHSNSIKCMCAIMHIIALSPVIPI